MGYLLTPRGSLTGSGWWACWIGPAWPADAEWPVVALVVSWRRCERLPRFCASRVAARRVCSIMGIDRDPMPGNMLSLGYGGG